MDEAGERVAKHLDSTWSPQISMLQWKIWRQEDFPNGEIAFLDAWNGTVASKDVSAVEVTETAIRRAEALQPSLNALSSATDGGRHRDGGGWPIRRSPLVTIPRSLTGVPLIRTCITEKEGDDLRLEKILVDFVADPDFDGAQQSWTKRVRYILAVLTCPSSPWVRLATMCATAIAATRGIRGSRAGALVQRFGLGCCHGLSMAPSARTRVAQSASRLACPASLDSNRPRTG